MHALLITFSDPNPDKILELIQKHSYAKFNENTYVISTDLTPKAIFDYLEQHTDINGEVYVMSVGRPFDGVQKYAEDEKFRWLDRLLV